MGFCRAGNTIILVVQVNAVTEFTIPASYTVWSYNIATGSVGQLDSEYIGKAVGIALLSSLETEIRAFPVWSPPS